MTAISEPASKEEFAQQVHDCLAHLYDYTFLHDHPLVHQFVPGTTESNRVHTFRQIVLEAIERLKPGSEMAFHSRQGRSYNILMLRYVEEQPSQEIMHQLALSERQFYREHHKAVETVSLILQERLKQPATAPAYPETAITVQSEVQRIRERSKDAPVDLEAVLAGAIKATQSLADQRGVVTKFRLVRQSSIFFADRTVLRQLIIWVMSQFILQCDTGSHLHIDGEITDHRCRLVFTLAAPQIDATSLQDGLVQHETLASLLDTLEASLAYTQVEPGAFRLALDLPLGQQTILVIDDNPDVVELFRRYLAGQAYQLVGAGDGKQAVQLAREIQPEIIVLDVMLPGQDGWEILQNLKNHPTTRHIPVLVCSVLDTPDLAFSLGADAFVKKPPGRVDFLNTLAQWRG